MTRKQANKFIVDNADTMFTVDIARATGFNKNVVIRKVSELRYKQGGKPKIKKEIKYQGKYVYVQQLRARVKIREGSSVEEYLTQLQAGRDNTATKGICVNRNIQK